MLENIRQMFRRNGNPAAPDPPPLPAKAADDHDRLIEDYLAAAVQLGPWYATKPMTTAAAEAILKQTPDQLAATLMVAFARLTEARRRMKPKRSYSSDDRDWVRELRLKTLVSAILRRKLPLHRDQLLALLRAADDDCWQYILNFPAVGVISAAEHYLQTHPLDDDLETALRRFHSARMFDYYGRDTKETRKLLARVEALLGNRRPITIEPGDAWADVALPALHAMDAPARSGFECLFAHALSASASKPSQKYLKKAKQIIGEIGEARFAECMGHWLRRVGRPGSRPPQWYPGVDPEPTMLHDANADMLKGLTWACATIEHEDVARALADAAEACFKKLPNVGPRCAKLGNACLIALSMMPGNAPAAQLARLQPRIKQPTGRKSVAQALTAVANRTGQTLDDLAELAVPTYGLDSTGRREQPIGQFIARLSIAGSTSVALTWLTSAGKVQKSVPADVKRDHPDELKDLKHTIRDIEKMLPAQRTRFEQLLMSQRQWPVEQWRERYIDHPLLSHLARRLVWRFHEGERTLAGAWLADRLVTADDQPLPALSAEARVSLWHPIGSSTNEVVAWRRWMERHEVAQPFKQAHREVYILTDAELATRIYSNRFAGHVVRQHQFVALCQQRGWRTGLQGSWDGGDQTPTIRLPRWNLRAEFWTDVPNIDHADAYTNMGIAAYLTTDQVRFYREDPRDQLELLDVPAIVFSEIMRDVDLFVGVASVGNDPNWRDGGPDGRYRDYWQEISFGDLSASAKTRREVLERLVPRLKIAERCRVSDRFLIVRGDIRTYKIHLGSGNILMEPNDQYLCIVPARGAAGDLENRDIFLPFEGDNTLAVILSKAFLLARDRNIKDSTITRQINQ